MGILDRYAGPDAPEGSAAHSAWELAHRITCLLEEVRDAVNGSSSEGETQATVLPFQVVTDGTGAGTAVLNPRAGVDYRVDDYGWTLQPGFAAQGVISLYRDDVNPIALIRTAALTALGVQVSTAKLRAPVKIVVSVTGAAANSIVDGRVTATAITLGRPRLTTHT